MLYKIINLLLILFFAAALTGCSSSKNCTPEENFQIDFYSSGGFTSITNGITIDCVGLVKSWQVNNGNEKIFRDSLKLEDSTFNAIHRLLNDNAWLTYKNDFRGNVTTYLHIKLKNQTNEISFNSFDLPLNMPASLTELITIIKSIRFKE